jgi:hypothetical protein
MPPAPEEVEAEDESVTLYDIDPVFQNRILKWLIETGSTIDIGIAGEDFVVTASDGSEARDKDLEAALNGVIGSNAKVRRMARGFGVRVHEALMAHAAHITFQAEGDGFRVMVSSQGAKGEGVDEDFEFALLLAEDNFLAHAPASPMPPEKYRALEQALVPAAQRQAESEEQLRRALLEPRAGLEENARRHGHRQGYTAWMAEVDDIARSEHPDMFNEGTLSYVSPRFWHHAYARGLTPRYAVDEAASESSLGMEGNPHPMGAGGGHHGVSRERRSASAFRRPQSHSKNFGTDEAAARRFERELRSSGAEDVSVVFGDGISVHWEPAPRMARNEYTENAHPMAANADQWFVVVPGERVVESGWEYREDAADAAKPGGNWGPARDIQAKVVSRSRLRQHGIDPANPFGYGTPYGKYTENARGRTKPAYMMSIAERAKHHPSGEEYPTYSWPPTRQMWEEETPEMRKHSLASREYFIKRWGRDPVSPEQDWPAMSRNPAYSQISRRGTESGFGMWRVMVSGGDIDPQAFGNYDEAVAHAQGKYGPSGWTVEWASSGHT